jgi:hypothetical protein
VLLTFDNNAVVSTHNRIIPGYTPEYRISQEGAAVIVGDPEVRSSRENCAQIGGATMNEDERKQIVKAYFDGIAAKDMSRVPWAKDATLRTPLNAEGGESALLRGRKASNRRGKRLNLSFSSACDYESVLSRFFQSPDAKL